MCRSIHNKEILDTCSDDFMYLSCVRFVKQVGAPLSPFLALVYIRELQARHTLLHMTCITRWPRMRLRSDKGGQCMGVLAHVLATCMP